MSRLGPDNESFDQSRKLPNVGVCDANLSLRSSEVHPRGSVLFQKQTTIAERDGDTSVGWKGV
jgi:hypothetical protein